MMKKNDAIKWPRTIWQVLGCLAFFASALPAHAYTLEYAQTHDETSYNTGAYVHAWYDTGTNHLGSNSNGITKVEVELSQSDAGCQAQAIEMLLQSAGGTDTSTNTVTLTGSKATYAFYFASPHAHVNTLTEIDVEESGGTNNCLNAHPAQRYASNASQTAGWTTTYCNGASCGTFNSTTNDLWVNVYSGSGAPSISGVTVTSDINSAYVAWTTDVNASRHLEYGLTSSYGTTAVDDGTTGPAYDGTSHAWNVTGLAAGTTYHYKICATDANGTACTTDATFATTGSDPRASPAAAFYDPPTGRIFGPGILNAYTFRVATNIDSVLYPSESVIFDYQIRDSGDTTTLYENPALPFLLDNATVCGSPGDCTKEYYAVLFTTPYDFPAGTYHLRVRAKTVAVGTYGSWSDNLVVTVQLASPTCRLFPDVWTAPSAGDGLPCAWTWLQWLFQVPTSGLETAWSNLGLRVRTRWPIAYLFDAIEDVKTGLGGTVEACPLPAITNTNVDGIVIPGITPCSVIDDARSSLDADSDLQVAGEKTVFLVGTIAAIIIGYNAFMP